MMKVKTQGRRGRPLGFKLSEESKRAISCSKKGQHHSRETRDKISRSLLNYFKRLNPISEEITKMYCKFGSEDEVCDWLNDVIEELDTSEDIMTIKSLRNSRKVEIAYGDSIEYFSHNVNPELLILAREAAELCGMNLTDYLTEFDED